MEGGTYVRRFHWGPCPSRWSSAFAPTSLHLLKGPLCSVLELALRRGAFGLRGRSSHPMSADGVHDLGTLHQNDAAPSDKLARGVKTTPAHQVRYDMRWRLG